MLSQFEVALRNKIDLVFSRHMGTDWIFDFVRSDPKLTDEQNITDRNELIDSMTFAFWSRLFMVDQEERICCVINVLRFHIIRCQNNRIGDGVKKSPIGLFIYSFYNQCHL